MMPSRARAQSLSAALAATVLALPLFVAACQHDAAATSPTESVPPSTEERSGGRIELSPKQREAAGIRTTPAVERGLGQDLRVTAVIKPNEYRFAHVSPRIPGKAIDVKAVLGDHVELGQTLALLDSLELGEKKAGFLQARTNREVARRNADREARLFKQQISSEKEYLEAKGDFERSDAAFQAAREALRLVGLTDREIEHITWGSTEHPLSHFPLLAPFAGTVVEQHITIGELIEPQENAYTIADLATVWALLDIFERDLALVAMGDEVQIVIDAYPGEVFRGRVTYVSSLLDATTRTVQARVDLENRDGRLRPGLFATAIIRTTRRHGRAAVVIPRDAALRVRGTVAAFVEEAPGTYHLRELALGQESGADVEVRSGVAVGERVVTEGAFYLKSKFLKDEVGEP
jgi:cobalt-zinc-cadmium efflux system membrane fusion protein